MKQMAKKVTATFLVAIMMLAMGVTSFAAENETTYSGKYSATATLYKDAACTELSMGNDAIVSAEIDIVNGMATITLKTQDITVTRMGITATGHLTELTLIAGDQSYAAQVGPDGESLFTIPNIPANLIAEGVVFSAKCKASVVIIPVNMDGYMKFTNIVPKI